MSPFLTPLSSMESSKDYEAVAKRWYELLCALAPDYTDVDPDLDDGLGESTPWDELPEGYRKLLAMVVTNLIAEGTIR